MDRLIVKAPARIANESKTFIEAKMIDKSKEMEETFDVVLKLTVTKEFITNELANPETKKTIEELETIELLTKN